MSGNSFGAQILMALVLSVSGAALVTVGGIWLGTSLALLLGIILSAGCYLAWLYFGRHGRAGLSLVMLGWLLLAGVTLGVSLSAVLVLLIFTVMVWLVRSSLRYSKPMLAAGDALLCMVSVAVCIWVAYSTHSVFLSFWSFFLTQALAFFIPQVDSGNPAPGVAGDRFCVARCNAEAALKRI